MSASPARKGPAASSAGGGKRPGRGGRSTDRFVCLKALKLCCAASYRAAWTSDVALSPKTLPREFSMPLPPDFAFGEFYSFDWVPALPGAAAEAMHDAIVQKLAKGGAGSRGAGSPTRGKGTGRKKRADGSAVLGVQHVSAHRLELFMRKEGIRVVGLEGVEGMEEEEEYEETVGGTAEEGKEGHREKGGAQPGARDPAEGKQGDEDEAAAGVGVEAEDAPVTGKGGAASGASATGAASRDRIAPPSRPLAADALPHRAAEAAEKPGREEASASAMASDRPIDAANATHKQLQQSQGKAREGLARAQACPTGVAFAVGSPAAGRGKGEYGDDAPRRVFAAGSGPTASGEGGPTERTGMDRPANGATESRPRGPDRVPVPQDEPLERGGLASAPAGAATGGGFSSPPRSMRDASRPPAGSSKTTLLRASDPVLALEHVAGMSGVPQKPLASGGGRGAEDLLWSASGDEIVYASGRFAVAMQADLASPGAADAYTAEELSAARRSQRVFSGDGGPIGQLALSDDGLLLATVQSVVARVHGRREGRVGTMVESGTSRRRRRGAGAGRGATDDDAALSTVPAIKLWSYRSGACLAALPCPQHESVGGVCIASDSKSVAVHGVDAKGRTLLMVWNTSAAAQHVLQSHGISASAAAGAAASTFGTATSEGYAAGGKSSAKPLLPLREFSVAARYVSDFAVTRARFSPFEHGRLVSCGHENVRFWRVKRGHLPGCPVVLDQHARGTEFTDVAFEPAPGGGGMSGALAPGAAGGAMALATIGGGATRSGPRVFVSTSRGAVVQIDYATLRVEAVFQVHSGPVRSLSVNEGFCVTAGADRYLRVWPLDFSEFFVEVRYESPLAASACSPDGLRVAATTDARAVGVLDISSRSYHTAARCHTGAILDVAIRPPTPVIPDRYFFLDGDRPTESLSSARAVVEHQEYGVSGGAHHIQSDNVATASADGTVRVWSYRSMQYLFEFVAPGDVPTCVCFRPPSTVPDSAAAAVGAALTSSVLGATTGRESSAAGVLEGATAEAEDTADAAVAEYHLAVGYRSGCVRVFHVPSAQLVEEYRQHDAPVRRISFAAPPPPGASPTEMRRSREALDGWALRAEPAAQRAQPLLMLSAGEDGRVVVHDALHGYVPVRVLLVSSVPSGAVSAGVGLDVSQSGSLIAASFSWKQSGDSGLRGASSVATVLDSFSFSAVSRLRVPGLPASRLASRRVADPVEETSARAEAEDMLRAGLAADSKSAAAASGGSRSESGIGPAVVALRFVHGGGYVAATMADGRILRWDTRTGRVLRDLAAVESRARPSPSTETTVVDGTTRIPLDTSPNGFFLVTGSPRGTVRVWDATLAGPPRDSAVSMSPPGGHSGAVSAVVFGWNGEAVYTGGVDGSLVVWKVGVEAGRRVCTGHLAPSAVRIATLASSEAALEDDRSMSASGTRAGLDGDVGPSEGRGPSLLMAPGLGHGAARDVGDGEGRGGGLHHSPAKTNLHDDKFARSGKGGFSDQPFDGEGVGIHDDGEEIGAGSLGDIEGLVHDPPSGRPARRYGRRAAESRGKGGRGDRPLYHASPPRPRYGPGELPPPPTSPVPALPGSATPTAVARARLQAGASDGLRASEVYPPSFPGPGQDGVEFAGTEGAESYPAPLPVLRERVPASSNALPRSRALGCSCDTREKGAVLWHPTTSMLAYRVGSTLVCEDASLAEQLFVRPQDLFCEAAIAMGLKRATAGESGLQDPRGTPPIPARLGPEARGIAAGSWSIDCLASVQPTGRTSTDVIAIGSSPSDELYRRGALAGIAITEREIGSVGAGGAGKQGTARFARYAVLAFRAGHVKQKSSHSGHRSRRMTTVLARRVLACCLGPDGNTVFGIAEAEDQPIGTGVAARAEMGGTSDARRLATDGTSSSASSSTGFDQQGSDGNTRTLLVCAWTLNQMHEKPADGREARIAALAEYMGVAPARKPIVILPAAQRRLRIRATEARGQPVAGTPSDQGILHRSGVVSQMRCLTNRIALVAGVMGLIEIRAQPKRLPATGTGGHGESDGGEGSDEMGGAALPSQAHAGGRARMSYRDDVELAMRPLVAARSMQKGLPPVYSASGFQPCMKTVAAMPLDFDEDDPVPGPVGLVCAGDNAGRIWLLRAEYVYSRGGTSGGGAPAGTSFKAKYSVVGCEWMRAPFSFGRGIPTNSITPITSTEWVRLPSSQWEGEVSMPARYVVGPWYLVSGNDKGYLALWNVVAAGATPGVERRAAPRQMDAAASRSALYLVARRDLGSGSPLLGGILDSAWAMSSDVSDGGVDGVIAMQGCAGGLYFVDWRDPSGFPCLMVPAAGVQSSSGIATAASLVVSQSPSGGGSQTKLAVSNRDGLAGSASSRKQVSQPVVVVAKNWAHEATEDTSAAMAGASSFQVWTMGAPGGNGAGPQPVMDSRLEVLPGALGASSHGPQPTSIAAVPGKEWEQYLLESYGSEMEDLARRQAFPASLSEIMSGEPDKSGALPFAIPKRSSAARGKHVAVGFSDGAIQVLRLSNGGASKELRAAARPHDAAVTCLAWTHALLRSPGAASVDIPDMRPGTRGVKGATRRRRADVARQAPNFWVLVAGYADGTVTLLPFAPDEENEAVNAEAADVADLATAAADELSAAARGQRKRPRRPESLKRAGGLTSVTELPIQLQEPCHVVLEPSSGGPQSHGGAASVLSPAGGSLGATFRSEVELQSLKTDRGSVKRSLGSKGRDDAIMGSCITRGDLPSGIPVTSVACSMWDPMQFAVAMADGTVRHYAMSVAAPSPSSVDAVVNRTAKQERAAVKERARSRKVQRQVAAGGASAVVAQSAAAGAAGEARDLVGGVVASSLSNAVRLPTSLDVAMELRVEKRFEAQLPWSAVGDGPSADGEDADASHVSSAMGGPSPAAAAAEVEAKALGPFLCYSPAMPCTLACVAATNAFDDPALATADEEYQVASMRFLAEGATRAAMADGSIARVQRSRSALWVFDTQSHTCAESVVLDGAHVAAMVAAPKMRVKASIGDTAAVVDSAARAATDPVARAERLREAASDGVGFEDEEDEDHDGSVLLAGGAMGSDSDELEYALGDGGALVVGTTDGRVELLRAATEGAPGPGAEALASVHLSQATASVGGSSGGMGFAAPRPRGLAVSSTDGLGSSGGRAGDRLAVGQTADGAAVVSLGVLQGDQTLAGRGGPGGTPGADAPVVRLLAATQSGMHSFDVGIDMN